jgi:two-component system, OmpR family, phosphate regulon sensor histidine kinase PhoR
MEAIAALVSVVGERRAWLSLLFCASRMPLGALYFLVPAALGVAGVVLVHAAGLGLPILVLGLASAWALSAFERQLGRWWLGVELAPRSLGAGAASPWARLRTFLGSAVTWRSLAYLLLQLPLGALAFAVFAGAAAAALALMTAPLAYLLAVGSSTPGDLDPPGLGLRLAGALAGAVLGLAALHLARPAGWAYGRLIQLMLGMGMAERELAAARSEAAAERARAEGLDRKRQDLIASVSHELRTPAASIRGHAEALLNPREPISDDQRRQLLEVLAREAARLGTLTDDLLAVARTATGALKLDLGPVEVGDVVEHVVAALGPIATRDREVTLLKAVAPGVPAAWADRDRLDQVLMNLVRNAITYTPDGGMVSVGLSEGAGRVALVVEDTGVGIPPEDLERVFERFYRTDASRSRLTGGFGLGLAIARELAEAMEGSIEAQSVPGAGSRFTVLLRRAA